MREIDQIVADYQAYKNKNVKSCLATLVHLQGSSYRRPGARMLISEQGRLTGAISGGCLEGDAMRKALNAMNKSHPTLVTYDSMDDDDATLGIGLGCTGIIKILIEPIDYFNENNAVEILKHSTDIRQEAVVVSLFNLDNANQFFSGTKFCFYPQTSMEVSQFVTLQDDKNYAEFEKVLDKTDLYNKSKEVFNRKTSAWESCAIENIEYKIFYEFIPPMPKLYIVGGGNDVKPLVNMANILSWQSTVIDGRPGYASEERFESACSVLVAKPENILEQIEIDDHTIFLLMTHNYVYDKALLSLLIKSPILYVAMLGPKKKLERMMAEYEDEGITFSAEEIAKIHSPAGLDLGAETPEEIAISILAEVQAFLRKRNGMALREKVGGIHV